MRRETSPLRERFLNAAWFAACGLLAWSAAYFVSMLSRPAALGVFALAGALAGIRVMAGWRLLVGGAVTFLIGNAVAFLPIVATQAMTGDRQFERFVIPAVGILAAAFGLGAVVGFAGVISKDIRAYRFIVISFAAGGAVGGVLLSLALMTGSVTLGILALCVPLASGGVAVSAAADALDPIAQDRGGRRLGSGGALAVLALAAVLLAGASYRSYWQLRSSAESRLAFARTDPSMLRDHAALYNGLARLLAPGDANAALSPAQREALEVYLAVRFRSRIESGPPLVVAELQALANELGKRHADKAEADLLAAAELLGAPMLDGLNRPYIRR